jgi:uncharacterized membrane protein YqjE
MKERSNINKDQFDDLAETNDSSQSGGRAISLILKDIVNHVTEIIRSEVRLAQTEVRQDVTQVAKASILCAIGAVFGLFALGFILLGLVYVLESTMPPWLSAVTVGTGVGIVAAIFLLAGRTKMKLASLKPDETIRTLQENVTWIKKRAG